MDERDRKARQEDAQNLIKELKQLAANQQALADLIQRDAHGAPDEGEVREVMHLVCEGQHNPDGPTDSVWEMIERCRVQDGETWPEFASILEEYDRENRASSADSYVPTTTIPTMNAWSEDTNSLRTSMNPPPQPSATGGPFSMPSHPAHSVPRFDRAVHAIAEAEWKRRDIEVRNYQMALGLVRLKHAS